MARVVLSPLYFTSEYLLRRPLGALTVAAERGDWPRKLYDFFAFGPDHKIGFIPAGFVAFDFNPSVGIYAFWDDAFTKHNDLRLHYEAWPTDWIAASITDSYRFTDSSTVTLHVVGHERPDNVFYGNRALHAPIGAEPVHRHALRRERHTEDEGVAIEPSRGGRAPS